MRVINISLIMGMVLLLGANVYAQGPDAKSNRKAAMDAFNEKYDNNWTIRWDKNTGTPASILGHRITSYSGTPEEIAKAFLAEEKGMLGIENIEQDLTLAKTNYSDKGGARLQFIQVYQGVPVLYSGYLVAVGNDGGIYYISGDYFPEVKVKTTPIISSLDATEIVKGDLSGGVLDSITQPLLAILPEVDETEERYTLVYQVDVSNPPFFSWRYTVDARNGTVLSKVDLISRVNGSGYVYQTNPDHGGVVTRTLHRLDDEEPRILFGDNVQVWNDDGDEAESETGQFYYSTSNTHFDEVMAYYHSDEFEAWLIGKGMGTSKVAKVTVHTHNPSHYAAADPPSRIIYLSDGGSGLNDPAKEAAVITHEYMHVVSETYNSLTQNIEARAMDEAYSDYFAVAYTNQWYSDSEILEYCDQSGGDNYKRNLINYYTYSQFGEPSLDVAPDDGETDEHENGMIFSGALWDFRRDADVSSSDADEIVLESLNNLDSYPNFLEGRDALETAAVACGHSSYLNDIAAAFNAHGIPPPPPAPTGLVLQNEGEYDEAPELYWNSSAGATSYKVYRRFDGGSWVYVATTSYLGYTDYDATVNYWSDYWLEYYVTAVNAGGESGSSNIVGDWGYLEKRVIPDEGSNLPVAYSLKPNHPNPFNPATAIRYDLPEASRVSLVIYDIAGREVRSWNLQEQAGYRHVMWDAMDQGGRMVPAGIYIYRLVAASVESDQRFTATRKMVLLK